MASSDVFFSLMENLVTHMRGIGASHRLRVAFALLLAAAALFPARALSASRAGVGDEGAHVRWKQVPEAQVKLDDKTPLAWNVFQPDKKDKKDKKRSSDLVLVLLGHRYLMVDTKTRLVYAVPLSEIHAQGADFDSEDLAQKAQLIPSTDWSVRDVGPAELIVLTLGDYGRTLQVTLPHPPDLRPFY
jgi:hypothetical protein